MTEEQSLELREYLKKHLEIAVVCQTDFLGTPEVRVVLILDGETISESTSTIPEHYHDPDW